MTPACKLNFENAQDSPVSMTALATAFKHLVYDECNYK